MGGVAWTEEEDRLLRECIQRYGEGKWYRIPLLAGLNRCRKSCRLRWFNYLRPNIKRGSFTNEEVQHIIKLHKLYGNRWSLIASRLPGRTANDVKNHWNCHLSKRLNNSHHVETTETTRNHTQDENNNTQSESHEYLERSKMVQNNDPVVFNPTPEPRPTQPSKCGTVSSEMIIPYVRDESYDDQAILTIQQYEKYSGTEGHGIPEELSKSMDFELEEIKTTMGHEQSKCKWDFDELAFDWELWTESL